MTQITSSPAVTLYGPSAAPFVEKVVRALRLKKLDYRLVEPESDADYERWSPETGKLPVIDVDGTRVPDSSRILDFLDERFPEPPLLSPDPKTARAQRRLEEWVSETFFFYWVNWLQNRVETDEEEEEREAPRPRRLTRLGILRRDPKLASIAMHVAKSGGSLGREFERRLDDLLNFLGTRPYFHSDRISRADLAVYSFCVSMRSGVVAGGPKLLEARPTLLEHMDRVEQETRG